MLMSAADTQYRTVPLGSSVVLRQARDSSTVSATDSIASGEIRVAAELRSNCTGDFDSARETSG